jgi:DNA-binding MarR family transcriptional regulator
MLSSQKQSFYCRRFSCKKVEKSTIKLTNPPNTQKLLLDRGNTTMTKTGDNAIDLGLHLPFQIAQLHSALNAQIKVILSRYGDLNLAQWRIVRVVALGIADTSTAVRNATGIDKGQFSKMLSVLVERGYIVLHPYEDDKRQNVIELTKLGRASHARLGPLLDARQKHLLASLSEDEQAVVKKAIKAIAKAANKTDFDIPVPPLEGLD